MRRANWHYGMDLWIYGAGSRVLFHIAKRSEGAAEAAPSLLCRLPNQQVPLCRSGPVCASWSAACAAASLAVNNRKGEQDT